MSDTPRDDEPEFRDPTAPSDAGDSSSDSTAPIDTSDTERAPQAPYTPPPAPASTPQDPYAAPPAPGAAGPQNPYAAPPPQGPRPGSGAPQDSAPPPGYGAPPSGYGAPPSGYGAPPSGYGAPPPGYGAPPPGYGAPGYGTAPYGGPSRSMSGNTIALLVVSGLATLSCGVGIIALVFAIIAATKNDEPAEQAKFTRWGWWALGITVALAVLAGIGLVVGIVSSSTGDGFTTGY